MNAHASSLDIDKFRKVVGLMRDASTTDGERAVAKGKAELIAARAGLSIETALSILDAQKPAPKFRNLMDDLDDAMEASHPGWKTEQVRKKAEREAKDAELRLDVLRRYGSEESLFARCEWELLLEAAIEPIATFDSWVDNKGQRHWYAEALDGVKPRNGFWSVDNITPRIRDAITTAYAWPPNLGDAVEELKRWEQLRCDRRLFNGGEWTHFLEVECRIEMLTDMVKNRPVAGWDDLEARLAWHRWDWSGQWIYPDDNDYDNAQPELARLREDFDILRRMAESRRQPKRRKHVDSRQPDLFSARG